MSLRKYLTSRVFFTQLFLALAIVLVLMFLFLQYIDFSTNHGQEITVPNLSKMTVEQAEDKLDELDLDYELLDTMDYNPSFPKFSIVKQDPMPGSKVKEDRKIYIKINAAGYTKVKVPNLIQHTLRQAESSLKAAGLELGSIKYVPDMGKDMVLKMYLDGNEVSPGEKVMKSSKIDLEVGDGKEDFKEEEEPVNDTIPKAEN